MSPVLLGTVAFVALISHLDDAARRASNIMISPEKQPFHSEGTAKTDAPIEYVFVQLTQVPFQVRSSILLLVK